MNPLRYLILCLTLLAFTACKTDDSQNPEVTTPITSTDQPNILLVIADDMGLDATPGYAEGSIKPAMPNLEALMATGLRFENFWSAPVCTPTRGTILTGKYGVSTGVVGVDDEMSLSETSIQKHLDDNSTGYSHAVIGKWHLGADASHPTDIGVGHYAGLLSGGVPSYTNWRLTENGTSSTSTEYSTTKFTDLAIDWVANQSSPWFLWLAYNAPHTPFHLPPADLHSQGSLPSDQASIDANPMPYYMAAIEAMDTEMGRLLSSLSAEERANTLVIFIGDNGTPGQVAQSPYGRRTSKGSLYQGGVNVPLVVSGPGVSRAADSEAALINSTDLFATIADLAGTGTTEWHNSKSFTGLFTSSDSGFRNMVYTEVDNGNTAGYTVRNDTYKLIVNGDGSREFYDLSSDPYESNDLMNSTLSTTATQAMNELATAAAAIRD